MEPYALKRGEGRTYRYGIDMTVKLGELHAGRGATFTEYTARKGEEPPDSARLAAYHTTRGSSSRVSEA
ncbi:MAG: hypothetical protein H0X37_15370 [Herpetosiphonaceae bacterium]|nr:hypothetical protein [Herpetosiphonaceae bacterium]